MIDLSPIFQMKSISDQINWDAANSLAAGMGRASYQKKKIAALTEAEKRQMAAALRQSDFASVATSLDPTAFGPTGFGSSARDVANALRPIEGVPAGYQYANAIDPGLGLDVPSMKRQLATGALGVGNYSGTGLQNPEAGYTRIEQGTPGLYEEANRIMLEQGAAPGFMDELGNARAMEQQQFERDLATGKAVREQQLNEAKAKEAEAKAVEAQANALAKTPGSKARAEWQKLEPKTRQAATASAKVLAMTDTNSDEYKTAIQDLYGNVMLRDDSGAVLAPSDQINIMMGSMTPDNQEKYIADYEKMLNRIYGTANVVNAAKNLPGQLGLSLGTAATVGTLIAGGGGGALIQALTEGKPEKLNAELMKLNNRFVREGFLDNTKVKETIDARYGIDIENGINSGFIKMPEKQQLEAAVETTMAAGGYYGFENKPKDAPADVDGDPIVAWIMKDGKPFAFTAGGGLYPWED
jgi:hypothetical protein